MASEIDRTALDPEKRKAPVNLMGGSRQGHVDLKIRATILDVEAAFLRVRLALKGNDFPLQYDSGSDPQLPVCLDRRKPYLGTAA